MKKTILAILLAALMAAVFALTGCQRTREADKDVFERILNTLLSMTSYEAEAAVTYISNRGSHTYQVRKQARMSGEYRLEVLAPERVAGNITVNNNRMITQFNTRVRGHYTTSAADTQERLELFVTQFVRNYLRSQEVTVSASTIEGSVATVLEAEIAGAHPYMRSQRLWVSNETLKPIRMAIFDPEGIERVVIEFTVFEYNVDFDDAIFRMEP